MLFSVRVFFLYSFVGFLLEVLFAKLTGQDGGRKCLLFLPLCPVYGVGALLILAMPAFLLTRPWGVYLMGGLLATLAEYAVGAFYTWGVGVRFWDYSQRPGNVAGHICPLFTLMWGFLALLLVYGLQPLLYPLMEKLPLDWLGVLFFFFAGDSLLSLCLLHRRGDPACLQWYRRM